MDPESDLLDAAGLAALDLHPQRNAEAAGGTGEVVGGPGPAPEALAAVAPVCDVHGGPEVELNGALEVRGADGTVGDHKQVLQVVELMRDRKRVGEGKRNLES